MKHRLYHAAYKVGFQSFNRSYSQLTFFNFLSKLLVLANATTAVLTSPHFC